MLKSDCRPDDNRLYLWLFGERVCMAVVYWNNMAPLRKAGGDLVFTLHAMTGTSPYQYANPAVSYPLATVKATLSETQPSSTRSNVTYTCSCDSANDCDLSPNTTYFVKAATSGGAEYAWQFTGLHSEFGTPPGNGWWIDQGLFRAWGAQSSSWGNWGSWNDYQEFQIDLQEKTSTIALDAAASLGPARPSPWPTTRATGG